MPVLLETHNLLVVIDCQNHGRTRMFENQPWDRILRSVTGMDAAHGVLPKCHDPVVSVQVSGGDHRPRRRLVRFAVAYASSGAAAYTGRGLGAVHSQGSSPLPFID